MPPGSCFLSAMRRPHHVPARAFYCRAQPLTKKASGGATGYKQQHRAIRSSAKLLVNLRKVACFHNKQSLIASLRSHLAGCWEKGRKRPVCGVLHPRRSKQAACDGLLPLLAASPAPCAVWVLLEAMLLALLEARHQ